MSAYLLHLLTLASIYSMVALSYAIPVGYTGLLNFGHIGLFAVGAYTSAIFTMRGFSFWTALVLASLITGIVGFLLALPTRKIRGDYYALMTLGFTFVVNAAILNLTFLTRGPLGISGIPRPSGFTDPMLFFFLTLIFLVIISFFVYRVMHSPFGLALEAVRDDSMVAQALGKPVYKLKVVSLTLSAVLVGIAGTFFAHFLQFINANVFWLDNVVWILAALVIGGLGSFRGAIAGMIILYFLSESVRFLPISPSYLGPLRLALFSFLLLCMVLFRPKGIFGRVQLEE